MKMVFNTLEHWILRGNDSLCSTQYFRILKIIEIAVFDGFIPLSRWYIWALVVYFVTLRQRK